MKQPTVTRLLEFDAGHRVMNHESKCATMHGHRYRVEVTASAQALDDIGRVIDFSVLKRLVGSWIDDHWDHTVILWSEDKAAIKGFQAIPGRKPAWIAPWNPTAENMAEWLLKTKCPELMAGTGVTVTGIVVYETPNCWAEAKL